MPRRDFPRKFLNKLLTRKVPSWHRKWAPSFRFLTARELSRSVEKEVNKIKRDSLIYHTSNRDLLNKLISLHKYKSLKKFSKIASDKNFTTRPKPVKEPKVMRRKAKGKLATEQVKIKKHGKASE